MHSENTNLQFNHQQVPTPPRVWAAAFTILGLLPGLVDPSSATAQEKGLFRPFRSKSVQKVTQTSLQADASKPAVPPSPKDVGEQESAADPAIDWEPSEPQRYTIDMTTSLTLATTVNPRIGLAHESVREALALELGAKALLLPTLSAGANYHLHSGRLQTSFGEIRSLDEQSIYFGGGARTLAAETLAVPAVRVFAQLGEAVYAPLAACQVVAQRNASAHAVSNLTLLDVATDYLLLTRAETRVEALRLSLEQFRETVRLTKSFAVAGQGRYADYHRARSHGLLMLMELQRAEEEAAVASADLAQLLRLDQSVQLETPSAPLELIVLTPPDTDLNYLVDVAQARRPEVRAHGAAIGAAEARVKQEYMRPWLPTLSMSASGGGFGGGSNRQDLGVSSFYQATGARTDFNVFAFWQLQNMGAGNRSLQQGRCAERDEAIQQRALTLNVIRREVSEAHANMQAARQRLHVAQVQLAAAEFAAEEDLKRTRAGEGLPIEVLNSLDLLTRARLDLVDAATAFNISQFQMFVVTGESPLSSQ
ncbi:MAG: TolC family protein [Planctomycetes bacterium]|nr:TolC family protein [Planctomycetota bacterium]